MYKNHHLNRLVKACGHKLLLVTIGRAQNHYSILNNCKIEIEKFILNYEKLALFIIN